MKREREGGGREKRNLRKRNLPIYASKGSRFGSRRTCYRGCSTLTRSVESSDLSSEEIEKGVLVLTHKFTGFNISNVL